MFRNYVLTAWRNMLRTKGYSALNISGLAIGMAVALLIGLWVYDQATYDRFLPDYQQLYQVRRNFNSNGQILNSVGTSLKLADALRTQIPEIEYVAEAGGNGHDVLMVDNRKFYLKGYNIGSDFLKMFRFPLVQGNAADVLKATYSIVLTESTAEALFGKEDPIGKTVRIGNKNDLKVTGIIKDLPYNSSFKFDYLVPFKYLEQTSPWVKASREGGFSGNSFAEYVKLKPGISYSQVAPKIKNIEKTEKDNSDAMLSDVVLQPTANWHLYSNYVNGKETGGFLEYVQMFAIIGVLVLLIACINFVNLSTARSEKRAKEVGVRKAIGSQRWNLIILFMAESFLLTLFAFLLAVTLVRLALPSFNTLTGSRIRIPYESALFWMILMAGVAITALLAGTRPAFYLSSFKTIKVLKGGGSIGKSAALPRKILLVAQFTCSIALIIGTIVIYRQIQYAKDRPTGLSVSRLLTTVMNEELNRNYTALKNDLLGKGIVSSVTTASSPATDIYWHSDIAQWPGKLAGERVEMGTIIVGADYFKTLEMDIAAGRDFDGITDTNNVIFNEAAIKRLRLKQPLSQVVKWDTTRSIVGVAKDALMLSPFAPADPTMFIYDPRDAGTVMMYRLAPNIGTRDAIAKLTTVFAKYNPSYPYQYAFTDETYAAKFHLEVLVGKLAGIFALLAIFISCMGLFGLAAYTAEQRTREIGIRKVLGASVGQIWFLLSRDFIMLVLLSCLIASPLAFYFLQKWLLKYQYRISIGARIFVIATVMAIAITIVTISFQAIKAALATPWKSLRSD
jgi:putative ABC transport system permease protein